MASIRGDVISAFAALLDDLSGVAVVRNQSSAIASTPAVLIMDGGQSHDDSQIAEGRYAMRVLAEGYVSAATADDVGAAVSDLYALIIQQVATDPTLGGVATYTREIGMEDPDIEDEPGFSPSASFSLEFEVEFVTNPANPTAAPV